MDELQTPIPAEPEPTNPEAEDDRPSLFKQVMGAVIGGALALGLYYGYEFAKPKVTAYLTLPVAEGGRLFDLGAASIADSSLEGEERKRFASKNAQAAARLQGEAFDNSVMHAVDNHDTDIDWPGHTTEEDPVAMVAEADEAEQDFEVSIMEEQMATMDAEADEDAWDDLWGDIRDREGEEDHERIERSNAAGLPDTGFGIGFVAVGAAGGAFGMRRKKK